MADLSAARKVLVLQGGGALGSYQAGVFEGLCEQDVAPDWVAGISIGAVNAALIAGNAPEHRLSRLREFWETVSSGVTAAPLAATGDLGRSFYNALSAGYVAAVGIPGFFAPRLPWPQFYPDGAPQALSYYDTAPLKATLERLVDFDRINTQATRLSVGAVNVQTGNFAYFDNTKQKIRPEHIMASGALPPGFPPVEIDGQHYWDGGIVSNTPLQFVLDELVPEDLLIFQVDLFSARGPLPRNLSEAAEREKDIRFSSRTRLNTDANLAIHKARVALRDLLANLPKHMADDPNVVLLESVAKEYAVSVVQLINRARACEGAAKDFEFSRPSMLDHWRDGLAEVRRTFVHREELMRRPAEGGVRTFDVARYD